jgi:YidC/Oxa1 family membrane protein insertase
MENRNLMIALILMLVVWVGFTVLFPQPQMKPAPSAPTVAQKTAPASVKETAKASPKVVSPANMGSKAVTKHLAAAQKEREITVDTDLFQAVFTNSGGRLKSLKLKKYFVSAKAGSARVSLIDTTKDRLSNLRLSGSDGIEIPADGLYTLSTKTDKIDLKGKESQQVVFSLETKDGIIIRKIYTFFGDRYQFDLQVKMTQAGNTVSQGNVALSLVHPWDESMEGGRYSFVGPATLVGEKVKTDKVKDIQKKAVTYGTGLVWTAFENKFFMGALVPLKGAGQHVELRTIEGGVENVVQSPRLSLEPGQTQSLHYMLYFGPRDLGILKKVDHQLNKAVDFGFFGPIARPLLSVLKFFYRYVGNYGVAIILLTVIIKLIFWPLTQKSYTSMKAMQTLQPKMQKIREKYKNDKERLNKEIMELYKKNKVNPLGGCLPMIIQIPVFFALYEVLLRSIALRQAPFIFWLTDLSVKDPYYITPIIMGVTMFIQQKMSPTTMDPTQAKLFLAMPIVFTFLFLNFPSGLVVYWLVNNLLTILQQYFINRKALPA